MRQDLFSLAFMKRAVETLVLRDGIGKTNLYRVHTREFCDSCKSVSTLNVNLGKLVHPSCNDVSIHNICESQGGSHGHQALHLPSISDIMTDIMCEHVQNLIRS